MMTELKVTTFDDEIARWHRFSDGAIGSKYALMTLFLATTPPELYGQLRETIISEPDKRQLSTQRNFMKKEYIKPQMDIISMDAPTTLLVGSGTEDDPYWTPPEEKEGCDTPWWCP